MFKPKINEKSKEIKKSGPSFEELYKEVLAYRLVDKELKDSLLKVYYDLSEKRLCYKFSQFLRKIFYYNIMN